MIAALLAAVAIAAWSTASCLVGHRYGRFLEREVERLTAARGELVVQATESRDAWAQAAAAERKELLERLDIAYANLSQAAFTQPTAPMDWPPVDYPPEAGEGATERARRVAAAEAIEAELNARVNGIDDYSLRAEGV